MPATGEDDTSSVIFARTDLNLNIRLYFSFNWTAREIARVTGSSSAALARHQEPYCNCFNLMPPCIQLGFETFSALACSAGPKESKAARGVLQVESLLPLHLTLAKSQS